MQQGIFHRFSWFLATDNKIRFSDFMGHQLEPAQARRLLDKLEFHYTPKQGSWLNMAEIEFSLLSREYLRDRMQDRDYLSQQVAAWVDERNAKGNSMNWRFTTEDARIKLKRLYPSI